MRIYAANTALVKTRTEEELLVMLDRERRKQIQRLKREQDKERGICAGLLLRHGFLEYGYSKDDWNRITVVKQEYGKPIIKDYPDFHYSLSHSGEWVVCAVDTVPIGIDIQMIKDVKLAMAKRFYHPKEYERLMNCDIIDLQKKNFFAMWAAKESYVKLTGRGIGEGIEQYITEHKYQQIWDEDGDRLADIQIYETIPGYIVCVCTREEREKVQLEIVSGIQE